MSVSSLLQAKSSDIFIFTNKLFAFFRSHDSNVLPYSQNFRFVSYRINLQVSSCLTKKENDIFTHIGKFSCGIYMISYT